MDVLRSVDNPAARRLKRLIQDAAYRRELGRAVAEGPHLAEEALKSGVARALWATEAAACASRELFAEARSRGLEPRLVAPGLFERLADTRTPQGWLCEVEPKSPEADPGCLLLLALDAIQDPGNLGTLLRCAWAAEAGLLLGKGCADPWSPKVLRAGAGAQFHVALRSGVELAQELAELSAKGWAVLGTSPRGSRSYLEADLRSGVCWVLGSEGQGMAPDVEAVCTDRVRIPYPGGAESLNAAVSGAVLLFETLRQRGNAKGSTRS
jgi:TrmH family RNA methyltransferase